MMTCHDLILMMGKNQEETIDVELDDPNSSLTCIDFFFEVF